jgi:hypothetical protein
MDLVKDTQFQDNKAVVTYEFSGDDIEVLKHLKAHGYMEFRRGANSAIVDSLYDYGFVKTDDDAWHYTIVLSKLGESVVNAMS